MPNTINLRLLDNKNIIAEMKGIPLANENSYKIIAGEENATVFQIVSKPTQYADARYTVEMVNSQGYGFAETDIIQDTFTLPNGMAVAGYGWVQIRAYKDRQVVPFMTLKVKVWNTIPNWKEYIVEEGKITQSFGDAENKTISQKVITEKINELEENIENSKITISQTTGTSETEVMSQKSVTEELAKKLNKTGGDVTGAIYLNGTDGADDTTDNGRILALFQDGNRYNHNIIQPYESASGKRTIVVGNTNDELNFLAENKDKFIVRFNGENESHDVAIDTDIEELQDQLDEKLDKAGGTITGQLNIISPHVISGNTGSAIRATFPNDENYNVAQAYTSSKEGAKRIITLGSTSTTMNLMATSKEEFVVSFDDDKPPHRIALLEDVSEGGSTPTINNYELIEKIIIGYSITTAQPDDWATNYTAYFTNTGTDREPVYTAVTSDTVPTWEAGKYYSYSDVGATINRSVEPDGTPYNFKNLVVMYEVSDKATSASYLYTYVRLKQSNDNSPINLLYFPNTSGIKANAKSFVSNQLIRLGKGLYQGFQSTGQWGWNDTSTYQYGQIMNKYLQSTTPIPEDAYIANISTAQVLPQQSIVYIYAIRN